MIQPLELTVSMPARNSAAYIRAAIDSALAQQDVAFELIVVDDGSDDGTGDIVAAVSDDRVRLLRNATRRGIGYSHNLVLAKSRAPFIVHFDSDDLIIHSQAFRKLLDRIQADDGLGLVHAHFIHIDQDGHAFRERCRKMLAYQQQTRKPGRDYRTALLSEGSVMNHLRLFRKSVFDKIGPFNEALRYGEDYEMALRIAEHYRLDVVPEALAALRVHEKNTTNLRWQSLRYWWQRVILAERLSRAGKISYAHNRFVMALRGFAQVLAVPRSLDYCGVLVYRGRVALRGWLERQARHAYRWLLRRFAWWPLRPWPFVRTKVQPQPGCCAYYLWRFPATTFIAREIKALAAKGVPLIIIADEPDPQSGRDTELEVPGIRPIYLDAVTPADTRRYVSHMRRQRPIRYLYLCLYVLFHRYGFYKSFRDDRSLIERSVTLSCILQDSGATHVHTPWADRTAFVAMMAAELAGITFSIQARAHELHRRQQAFALKEKFNAAAFVITNCEYNRDFVASKLNTHCKEKIHIMYEGVDPKDFYLPTARENTGKPVMLLCVARLIEEKGLTHLLAACNELKRRGLDFRCEIIGGSERPTYMAYEIEVRKLHRQLGLASAVTISGSQPFSEVLQKYRTADIFVLPCVTAENGGRDITPNALIEAMACGLPVVSTRNGAIPEIVEDGVDGLLVPPGDPQAIADAIEGLVRDARLRALLATNARNKVEKKFNLAENIAVLAGLFARSGIQGCSRPERRTGS